MKRHRDFHESDEEILDLTSEEDKQANLLKENDQISLKTKTDRNGRSNFSHSFFPVCKFFNTKKGCRNGDSCRFVHMKK